MSLRWALRTLIVALPLAAAGTVASARSLSADEVASLEAKVKTFTTAMRSADPEMMSDIVPPKIARHLAQAAGVDPAGTQKMFADTLERVFEAATIKSFDMALTDAKHLEAANGNPYVLIPTVMELEVRSRPMVDKSETLALMDEGNWYLLSVRGPGQISTLKKVYPEFAGVEFPSGSLEAK